MHVAYTHFFGPHDSAHRVALKWLREQPGDGAILVLAPDRPSLDGLSTFLDAADLEVRTAKGFHGTGRARVLSLWNEAKVVGRVLSSHPDAIAVVPWGEPEIRWFLRAFNPIDLLGASTQRYECDIDDPIVHAAMAGLTLSVNLSSGLTHPSDKRAAIDTFETLRHFDYRWDDETLLAWAVANGWRYEDAHELVQEIAAGVAKGKTFRPRHSPTRMLVDHDKLLAVWQARADRTAE